MSWHAFPSAPQIAHWYLKLTVPLPLQVPGFAVSVPPTLASPVIVGAAVFAGPEAVAAATLAVGTLVAEFEPSELLASTTTRAVLPWSALANLYVCVVAPAIAWQPAPLASQICHWYWKVIGVDPFQVPGLAVAVLPTVAAPLIVGGELFDGA